MKKFDMNELTSAPEQTKPVTSDAVAGDRSSEPAPAAEVPVSTDPRHAKKSAKNAKKEARKAKKAARKAKKEAKKHETVLYIPEKMQGFRFSLPIGYLLRFFAIAFSIFGVLWLFCDAFALTDVSAMSLLLYCFGAVTAFSLIFIGRWFILAGIGIIAAYIGGFFLICGNLLTFFVSGIEYVINQMMVRLSDAGFASFGTVNLPDFGGLSYSVSRAQSLSHGGIFALATVLALIFAAFSAKRTRLLPMLITGGGLCAFCFTYNLCETNWGIACVLAGLCSAVVLSAYDKIYKDHKNSKKSRAYSGYSAALAGLLALVVLLIPAANMTDPWGEISFIAQPMDEARTVITTILTGGNPEYNKMNSLSDEQSNEIQSFEFENVELFEVQSYTKRPIYLRSWIAKDFNYDVNSWNQLSTLDEDEMRRILRTESPSFSGDQIAYDRYTLLDERLTVESLQKNNYVRNTDHGFSASYIDIEFINNSGLLYVLPSSYASPMGLLEFESRTENYREKYNLHADGMYTSGWLNLFKQYTAVAIQPDYMSGNYSIISANNIRYMELLIDHVAQVNNNFVTNESLIAAFREALDTAELTAYSTDAYEAYLSLTTAERSRWCSRYITLYNEYTAYVHDSYLQLPENMDSINEVYERIASSIDAASTDHDKIMVVIDYLAKNYTYSTSPYVDPEREHTHDLDYFLLESREGYCVQFATSAALLLRKAGYPARYVQGYIAQDFETSKDASGMMNYTAEVLDSNAHAWVEVYIDGLGWRTYETTPTYYESVYYIPNEPELPDSTVTLPPVTRPTQPVTTPSIVTTTPQVTSDDGTDGSSEDPADNSIEIDLMQVVKVLAVFAVIVLIVVLIVWQMRRARKIADGRTYFIDRAEYGSFEEKSDFDRVAGVICDSIYEVHYILGNRPKQGELPTEFAARIDRVPIDNSNQAKRMYDRLTMLPYTLSEVTTLIAKQEFGKTMNRTELAKLGSYLRALIASEYPRLPVWKKLWYRYIRFMI